MVSPISEAVAAPIAAEIATKLSGKKASVSGGSAQVNVPEGVSSRSNKTIHMPEVISTGDKTADKEIRPVKMGEVRKSEVKDGELMTKVYDRNGKLLRVIPPGYVPAGEPKYDITI